MTFRQSSAVDVAAAGMLFPDLPLQTIPHVRAYLRSADTRGLKELVFGKVNVFLWTPSLQQLTDVWARTVRERQSGEVEGEGEAGGMCSC